MPLIRALLVSSRVLGSSCSDSRMLASWFANRCRTAFEESTKAVRSSSRSASSSEISLKLWIERRMLWRRSASPPLIGDVAGEGLELAEGVRGLAAAALLGIERLGAARQQQLQEGLGVGVERGEELVGVDVGWVEASGIVAPSSMLGPSSLPGSTSITMSLRPVFGRSTGPRPP